MNWQPLLFRFLLPVVSGSLLALAFPPFNLSQFAWLSLVPLLFALEGCRWGEAFRRGYMTGLVFFAMTIWWIVHVTLPGTVGLIAFLALYFGAAAAWIGWLMQNGLWERPPRREMNGPVVAGTPLPRTDCVLRNFLVATLGTAGWVTLEWVRGRLLFGGFPWDFLGVSQWRAVPLIQFASVTGVYGVSALVCFMNFALYFTIHRFIKQLNKPGARYRLSWEFYAAMGLIGLAFIHGTREIFPKERKTFRTLRLALVQGNIPQTLKFEPEQKPMILERYRTLTETATLARVNLVVWPETATPEPLRYDSESFALATNLAVKAGAYLLTGTIDVTPYSSPSEMFNAAILIGPDGHLREIYRKLHLVPFGEYVPLHQVLPFMKWLTPIGDSLERGREFTMFHLDELRFGVVICFEDAVPEVYRGFVRRGADFMVNLTNDAWFKDSPAAEMHLANAVLRCAETRRPLVRCANNGVTCLVDEFGFVNPNARLTPFAQGSLVCDLRIPRIPGLTFYVAHGDWIVGLCAIVTGLTAGLGWRHKKTAERAS